MTEHDSVVAARSAAMSRLRQAQDRSFDREGVPMFLTLMTTGSPSPPADGASGPVAEGQRLAAELTEVRSALFPTRRDDDMGVLVATVQALTVGTFEPGARP